MPSLFSWNYPTTEEGSNLKSWIKLQGPRDLAEFLMWEPETMPHNDPGFQHPLDNTNHASAFVFFTVTEKDP